MRLSPWTLRRGEGGGGRGTTTKRWECVSEEKKAWTRATTTFPRSARGERARDDGSVGVGGAPKRLRRAGGRARPQEHLHRARHRAQPLRARRCVPKLGQRPTRLRFSRRSRASNPRRGGVSGGTRIPNRPRLFRATTRTGTPRRHLRARLDGLGMLAIDREASLGARGATPPRSEARSGTPSRGLAAGADPESKPPEAPRDERFSGRSPLAAVDANDPRSNVVARGAGDAKSSSRRDTDDARTPAASLDAEVRRADDSARVAGADENEAAPASARAADGHPPRRPRRIRPRAPSSTRRRPRSRVCVVARRTPIASPTNSSRTRTRRYPACAFSSRPRRPPRRARRRRRLEETPPRRFSPSRTASRPSSACFARLRSPARTRGCARRASAPPSRRRRAPRRRRVFAPSTTPRRAEPRRRPRALRWARAAAKEEAEAHWAETIGKANERANAAEAKATALAEEVKRLEERCAKTAEEKEGTRANSSGPANDEASEQSASEHSSMALALALADAKAHDAAASEEVAEARREEAAKEEAEAKLVDATRRARTTRAELERERVKSAAETRRADKAEAERGAGRLRASATSRRCAIASRKSRTGASLWRRRRSGASPRSSATRGRRGRRGDDAGSGRRRWRRRRRRRRRPSPARSGRRRTRRRDRGRRPDAASEAVIAELRLELEREARASAASSAASPSARAPRAATSPPPSARRRTRAPS